MPRTIRLVTSVVISTAERTRLERLEKRIMVGQRECTGRVR